MDFEIACDGLWMIKLIIPHDAIKTFIDRNVIMTQSFNAAFSVDKIVNNLATRKFKVDDKNYKVELDDVTMLTIVRFIEIAKQAKSIAAIIQEDYKLKVIAEFQTRFENDTKLSLDEIEKLFFGYSQEAFHDYLTRHGFSNIPGVEDLPEHTCATNEKIWQSAYPLNGWELISRPDGYGHECGSSIDVSYENRSLFRYGWSSDD